MTYKKTARRVSTKVILFWRGLAIASCKFVERKATKFVRRNKTISGRARKSCELEVRMAVAAALTPRCMLIVTSDAGCKISKSQTVGAPMATIQAAFHWIMLALTPSMVLVAVLLLRTDDQDLNSLSIHSSESEFDDQPLYPDAQQPHPAAQ